jgi:hypothetical protein
MVMASDDSKMQVCTFLAGDANMLACSVWKPDASVDRIIHASDSGRKLLSDKKTPLSQFQPKTLLISTLRVVATQASVTLSHFFTDQLESEMKTEERVKKGEISADDADKFNDDWEDKEWTLRWSNFPERCAYAVLKYQAITLVMRLYEYIFSKRVDAITLDKLTKDPFQAAIRTSKVTGRDSNEMMRPMFDTCLWSNAIAFLADYSVHQVILAYTYYVYIKEKRRRMIAEREAEVLLHVEHDSEEESEDTTAGAIAMTFTLKSTRLVVSRGLGLLACAAGGAYGSFWWPGWGTTLGQSLGDGLMSTALEEREK